MTTIKNLAGKQFGNLTVLDSFIKDKRIKWLCRCSCGKELYVLAYNLSNGHTKSCGCNHPNKIYKDFTITKTRLYTIWENINQRCSNPNNTNYIRYGNKGVDICKEWRCSKNFYEWAISNGYKDGLQIDRIDNSKGYSPDNCRWVTTKEQERNKTVVIKVTYKGIIKPLVSLAEDLGISPRLVYRRIKDGWSVEDAFEKPYRYRKKKGEK